MKKLKNNKTIFALIIGIVAVAIIVAIAVGRTSNDNTEQTTTVPTTQTGETVDDLVIDDNITSDASGAEITTGKDVEVIQLKEPETTKPISQKPSQQGNAVKPAEPVTQGKPSGSTPGKYIEIIDNGNDSVKEYSCGTKGHHCDSKETHNFILSLEKKGCPHCGSHSCKSFYTYDEWGNACYDPTKCENYNEKSDPLEYCQDCGKKIGTGSGNTCVRFTVDTKCPECGESVKSKACHSH